MLQLKMTSFIPIIMLAVHKLSTLLLKLKLPLTPHLLPALQLRVFMPERLRHGQLVQGLVMHCHGGNRQ